MPDQLSFRRFVTHPVTTIMAALGVLGGVAHVPFLDAIWAVLWSQAGTLFTVLSVGATTLAPAVSWLPVQELQVAALFAGGLFVLTQVSKLWAGLQDRLDDSNGET